jgi:3-deoxy-manno-octulosonate cytidylyltransferase (CMP-KDO synthetase)
MRLGSSTALKVHCRSQIIIPARLASTRLPRKLLLSETGKPLIQHTYEAASQASRPLGVCVAADCDEIADVVRNFGGNVQLTNPMAACGTDRVAEVARQMTDIDIIVNVQGDEPDLDGQAIDLAIECLETSPQAVMATLATPIRDRRPLEDPSCVKVVCDMNGRALYFSRSVIPHPRQWDEASLHQDPPLFLQHVGLYAYRREFLLEMANWSAAPTEQLESLEQLRVLHHGHQIQVAIVPEPAAGIDTPEDYRAFVNRWSNC